MSEQKANFKRVLPGELLSFWRRFLFTGGRLRRLKLQQVGRSEFVVELFLSLQSSTQTPVKLKLRFLGVEEYRFARRVGTSAARIPEARCSYLSDLFFLTLDAWNLEKGEQPKPHDFRASDAYLAARELWYEVVE